MEYDHYAFSLEFPGHRRANVVGIPPGFPLLHLPDGTLCELAFSVFDWLHDDRCLSMGTLRRLAFDLRQWLAFCSWRGWDAEEPNDERLAAWRTFLMDPSGGGLSAGLAEKKAARVFGIYVNLHRAMPVGRRGTRTSVILVMKDKATAAKDLLAVLCDDGPIEPAVGITGMDDRCSADRLTARRVRKGLRWTRAGRKQVSGLPKPIPTERQAGDVLVRLRSGVAGEGVADYPSYLADRDWLIGRAMQGAGCRAVECSRLSLDAISAMLTADGLLSGITALAGTHPLDALAADPIGWRALLGGLERLEAMGRKTMSLPVTGKNGKARLAPVDLGLVHDLLQVGVASARPAQIAAWRGAGWRGAPPAELFVSDRTKSALREGSIGDLLKHAFDIAPAIPGSGHRLRAFYAVTTAIRVFGDCLARFGGETSSTLVEAAHAELAAALGHSSISTTVTFYLDMARVFHAQGLKQRDQVLSVIQKEVANAPGRLTDEKLRVLAKTVRALLRAELGSEYMGLLDLLPENTDLRRLTASAA